MRLIDALNSATERFATAGIDAPRDNAEQLLCAVRNCPRSDLFVHATQTLTDAELQQFQTYVTQRLTRKPLQYIVGRVSFYSVTLTVTPAVLIPRPETELLVEAVLQRLPSGTVRVADIGTGSGAIALAIADQRPDAEIFATDISETALTVARENAVQTGCKSRIHFVRGDLLSPFTPSFWQSFDAIVSNPPYVAKHERDQLAPEVIQYEPHQALFSGQCGTSHHQQLIDGGWRYLKPGGILALEMGHGQAPTLSRLANATGHYRSLTILPDYNGIDRIFIGKIREPD
ncbi:MAG: peptide chain release factor N(5)-glutamine methyltransferase [Gemmatimonadetes bacterium]|nr:MAG: peptide chain release factor N(5)-glutamine methyltransferase [Gemmatimonadota bacterium]